MSAFPAVHFGRVGYETDWRNPDHADNTPDDDAVLARTPEDVVTLLGFDPLELEKTLGAVTKAAPGRLAPLAPSHEVIQQRQHLEAALRAFFSKAANALAVHVEQHWTRPAEKVDLASKAANALAAHVEQHWTRPEKVDLALVLKYQEREKAAALLNQLDGLIDWAALIKETTPVLERIASLSGRAAVTQVAPYRKALLKAKPGAAVNVATEPLVDEDAADWANAYAAELVGRKYDNGRLVDNPDARWNIAATTRDDLRDIITDAFEEASYPHELAMKIREAGAFSEGRATMIARTEMARASFEGHMIGWRNSNVVDRVGIQMSDDHPEPDECDEAAAGGPYSIDEVPDVPIHPGCFCAAYPLVAGLSED